MMKTKHGLAYNHYARVGAAPTTVHVERSREPYLSVCGIVIDRISPKAAQRATAEGRLCKRCTK